MLSDSAQPTITILRDGNPAAAELNSEGQSSVSLTSLLDPGSYIVEVGSANNTAGLVVVVVYNETPVTTTPLTPGNTLNATVSPAVPVMLYSISALTEPAFLYIESASTQHGVSAQIITTATGQVSGESSSDLLGARFRIPAGSATYQVEIRSLPVQAKAIPLPSAWLP